MPRECWILKVELPAGVGNGGRFVARLLKHLLRTWNVKCVAVLDTPPLATPTLAPGAGSVKETPHESVEGVNARETQ